MPESPRTQLERQVARARRRLFLQRFGRRLLVCSLAGLSLYAVFLLYFGLRRQSWDLDSEVFLLRLAGMGGVLLVAGVVALGLAWRRRPTLGDAALSVDEAFRLQERVATCLALEPGQEESEAGRALLADTAGRTEKLPLAGAYPLRPRRRVALLAPALLLAG